MAETIQAVMLVIMTIICGSGIPWAFQVGKRLASIEATIKEGIEQKFANVENRLESHSNKLNKLHEEHTDLKVELAKIGKGEKDV